MRAVSALALATSLLALAGCPMPESAAAHMQNTASDFNTNVRFGRMSLALESVAPKEREQFLARRKTWGDHIQIADYELISAKMKDNDNADVVVKYDWYEVTAGDLHTTKIHQKWHNQKGGWMLESEEREDGAPGILGEPAPAPEVSRPTESAQFPTVHLGN